MWRLTGFWFGKGYGLPAGPATRGAVTSRVYPLRVALPLVAMENLRDDQREAQGEARILLTKWAP
jgi:hypothetical protein